MPDGKHLLDIAMRKNDNRPSLNTVNMPIVWVMLGNFKEYWRRYTVIPAWLAALSGTNTRVSMLLEPTTCSMAVISVISLI